VPLAPSAPLGWTSQTRAQGTQAGEAARVGVVATNIAMFERVLETRRRFGEMPRIYEEWRTTHPSLARKYDEVGGVAVYDVLREAMDTFRDVYFMRRDVVTDHYWHVWKGTFFALYAPLPTFEDVFRFAAQEGYLHPDFVRWFEPRFRGAALADPKRA
jgi:hypothetical protein